MVLCQLGAIAETVGTWNEGTIIAKLTRYHCGATQYAWVETLYGPQPAHDAAWHLALRVRLP